MERIVLIISAHLLHQHLAILLMHCALHTCSHVLWERQIQGVPQGHPLVQVYHNTDAI